MAIALATEQKQSIGMAIGLGMLQRLLNQDLIDDDEYKLMVEEFKTEFIRVSNP